MLSSVGGCGPWLWPPDWQPQALSDALERAGLQAVPAAPSGAVLLLSANLEHGSATLSILCPDPPPAADALEVTAITRAAWRTATAAVARSVPVLWRSLHLVERRGPRVRHAGTVALPGGAGRPPRVLDDESFGLSFALAIASESLGVPCQHRVAASGVVDAGGRVGPVRALWAKAAALRQLAARVDTLLVSADQPADDVRAAEAAGVAVVPVRTVGEAVRRVLPDLEHVLARHGQDMEGRADWIEMVLRLALGERHGMVAWAPVAQATTVALDEWPALSAGDTERLRVARAIALRHDGRRDPIHEPPAWLLDQLPAPQALRLVAHLVQHAADTGTPDRAVAVRLAADHLPATLLQCHPQHLMIRGALARLRAVTGEPGPAAADQRDLAHAWLALDAPADATYALSEWFRLAGALGDHALFGEAEIFQDRASGVGDLDERGGLAFVELARARALCQLGRAQDALPMLSRRAMFTASATHVQASAVRWTVSALHAQGDSAAAQRQVEHLESLSAGSGEAHIATQARALIALDDALRQGDGDGTARAIKRLRGLEEEPLAMLMAAHASDGGGLGLGAYVARFYPY